MREPMQPTDRRGFLKQLGLVGAGVAAAGVVKAGITCQANFCDVGVPTAEMDRVYEPQQNSQWCWAACINMVFAHYGLYVPQREIVRRSFGGMVNMPATPDLIIANLNAAWRSQTGESFRVESDHTTAGPQLAASELRDGHPLIIGTMGHAMVLSAMRYSYDTVGRFQLYEMIVRDPWPGRGRRTLSPQEIQNLDRGFAVRIRARRSRFGL
jgi:hypothetical protein